MSMSKDGKEAVFAIFDICEVVYVGVDEFDVVFLGNDVRVAVFALIDGRRQCLCV